MRFERSQIVSVVSDYGLALAVVAIAVALRAAILPWVGLHTPYVTLFGGVAAAVWLRGWRASAVAAVAGYVAVTVLFVQADATIVPTPDDWIVDGFLCLASCALIIGLGERMRRARAAAEAARDALLLASAERGRNDERFRLAADAVNGLIYDYDMLTGKVERSRGMYEVTGYSAQEAPPTDEWWRQQIHPDDLPRVIAEFEGQTADTRLTRYRVRHRDGRWLHVEDRAVVGRDKNGRPVRLVGCTMDITERYRAEERLTAVLASIDDHLVSYDQEWRFTFVNDAAARMLGKSREELLGRSIWELFPEAVGNQYYNELHEAVRTQQVIRSEHYYAPFDRWFENHMYPSPDGVTVFAADVTERRRAQTDLQFQRFALDQVAIVAMTDLRGTITYANDKFCEISGYAREELVGQNHRILNSGLHPTAFFREMYRTISEGKVWRGEIRNRRKDGSCYWVDTTIVPALGRDGRPERYVAIRTDITHRKEAEQALREREHQLQVVTDVVPALISYVDRDLRYRFLNRQYETWFGVDPARSVGRHMVEVLGREAVAAMRPHVQTVLAGQRVHFETLSPYERGGRRWIDAQYIPDVGADGEVRGFFVFVQDTSQRKGFEQALAESEARYRTLAEAMPFAVWQTDKDGRPEYLNTFCREYTGMTPEDIRLRGWLAVVHPDESVALLRRWTHSLKTGEALDFEHRMRRGGTDEYRWFRGVAAAVRDADGALLRWVGATIDIHDRRVAEMALRESEATLRAFYDNSPVCMGVTEPLDDGDVLHLYDNPATCRFFGMEPGSTSGRRALAELQADPDVVAVWRKHYDESDRVGGPVHFEHEFTTAAGRRWLSVALSPIGVGPSGRTRFCYVAEDTTDRKAADVAVRESERKFRTLADNMSQFAWMADARGDIFWYNRRWFEYTGTTLEQVRGWGWTCVHHPDHVDRVVRSIQRAWDTGEAWEETFPLRGRDGEYRWFLSRAVPIADESGCVARWLGTNTDITERRAAEEALREADRRKDEFLATLAHELRNPLAPIRYAVHLLKLSHSPDAALKASRDVIERQVELMARLLDDLLDISRITRNKVELKKQRVALRDVMDSAIETSRLLIESAGHRLNVDLPDESVLLDADPVRLSQVFSNLLNNAAKYTDRAGRIDFEARRDGDQVVVVVRDTGIGIAPAMLPRIFEMFAQAAPALERAAGGLGIGLALAKGLVELHGGTIEACSDGVGKGSEFVVRLPLGRADFEHVAAVRSTAESTSRRPLRVLVADDNTDGARMLSLALRSMGHDVCTVHDGQEAVEAAATFVPDVALLDIGMPKLNGYEVARHLRIHAPGPLKLIALTGWGQPEDKRRSAEAGFDLHLVKPVEFVELEATLSELSQSVATRETAPPEPAC